MAFADFLRVSLQRISREDKEMLGYIGFGVVDNGVLIVSAIIGFSFEDIINNALSKIPRYCIKTRVKGLSSALLGAGIGNAVSDFLGGFCVSPSMALGTFVGCFIVLLAFTPFIFKITRKRG